MKPSSAPRKRILPSFFYDIGFYSDWNYGGYFFSGPLLKLYPEADYYLNPANLAQVFRPFFTSDFNFFNESTTDISRHTIGYNGLGSPDGEFSDKLNRISTDAGVSYLFPLNKDTVLGLAGQVLYYNSSDVQTYREFNTLLEDRTISDLNEQITLGSDFFLARRKGFLSYGFRFV